jgi:hypothetical protein
LEEGVSEWLKWISQAQHIFFNIYDYGQLLGDSAFAPPPNRILHDHRTRFEQLSEEIERLRRALQPLIGPNLEQTLLDSPVIDDLLHIGGEPPTSEGTSHYVFSFHAADGDVLSGNSAYFRTQFCQMFSIAPESIVRIDLVQGSLVYQVLTPKTVELESIDLMLNGKYEEVPDGLKKEQIWAHLEKTKTQFKIKVQRIPKGSETMELIKRMNATMPRNLSDPDDEARLTDFLRDAIGKSQIHDLRVQKITICSNSVLERKFQDVSGPTSIEKFLFHGAPVVNREELPNFVFTGIESRVLQTTDRGYFGRGFYMTSCIDYALFYQFGFSTVHQVTSVIKRQGNTFKMLVFACNLGRCQEFNESSDAADWRTTTYGKPLSHDIDSRHVIVGRSDRRTLAFHPKETIAPHELGKRSIYDEYVVQKGNRAYPLFCVEFQFIESDKYCYLARSQGPKRGKQWIFPAYSRSIQGSSHVDRSRK